MTNRAEHATSSDRTDRAAQLAIFSPFRQRLVAEAQLTASYDHRYGFHDDDDEHDRVIECIDPDAAGPTAMTASRAGRRMLRVSIEVLLRDPKQPHVAWGLRERVTTSIAVAATRNAAATPPAKRG